MIDATHAIAARKISETAWTTTLAPVPPPGAIATTAAITTMIKTLRTFALMLTPSSVPLPRRAQFRPLARRLPAGAEGALPRLAPEGLEQQLHFVGGDRGAGVAHLERGPPVRQAGRCPNPSPGS